MATESAFDSDILIVGAGIFGVSTAYHLAQQFPSPSNDFSKVTILDRAPAPSTLAASTDINKIVRADYSSPFYMSLAYEAMDAWANLPLFRDENVYHQTGWIAMDEKGSDLASRIRRNFRASGHEDVSYDLTEDKIRTLYGGLLSRADFSEYGSFYANPSAGWADAARAVELMANEAVRLGVNYEVGEVDRIVRNPEEKGDGVKGVQTRDGRIFTARKLLLATGAWTSWLMSGLEDELDMPDDGRIERQITAAGVCVAHFRLSPEEARVYEQLPVLIYGAKGEVLPPTDDHIFKFTNATSFKNTLPSLSSRHLVSVPPLNRSSQEDGIPSKLLTETTSLIPPRLPQIVSNGRQVDYFRLCWDAISPDQNQLITKHPDRRLGNLYFATAGSFHSWKFLPVIGKYVVNVLRDVSNGPEKDNAWKWKVDLDLKRRRGVHEKVVPKRELKDFE